jgi:hypothetical protein
MSFASLRTGLAVAFGTLFAVGCAGAVDRTPEPGDAADASPGPAPQAADSGPAAASGWASDAVCNAGARTLEACCELGASGDCASIAENVRCCGDKSCDDGKLIACMAAFVPSKADNCLGALSACNKM